MAKISILKLALAASNYCDLCTMQPINTVILSFGMSGQLFHAPFIHVQPGFDFYGVWERTKNVAQQKYPNVKTYRTFDEVLADEAVELVIVNTPNYTHHEYARKALLAAKHVVVEKPFVISVSEGEELIEIARENKCVLSVYHNRRYDSDFKIVRKIVQQGSLGQVVEAEFHFDRFKEELSPKQHKETPGPGTGALYDLGSHLIDQALQLFGVPEAVFADIRIIRRLSLVDDYFEVLLYYPDLRVRLHSSYLVREPMAAYQIHGLKGSFIKSKSDVQEMALQAGTMPVGAEWGEEPEEERGLLHAFADGHFKKEYVASERGNYGEYFEQLYQSIRNNKPLPVTPEDALKVIMIIEASFKSSDEKNVVYLS